MILHAAIIWTRTHQQTMHAPYTHILGHVAWAGWPRHDLYHLPCARLNREIPPSVSSPKKVNWENRHISLIVHDVFYARFEFWVPTTFAKHFETVSQQLHHRFHHKFRYHFIITFVINYSPITHRVAEFFFADWDSVCNYYVILCCVAIWDMNHNIMVQNCYTGV